MPEDNDHVVSKRDFVVAGISFIVSGIGGALFQSWLSRAKPSVEVTSFGFDGVKTPFRISDELRQRTDADSWGESLEETATFEALRDRFRSTLDLIQRHERAIPAVEKWIGGARSLANQKLSGSPMQLSAAEVAAHPYMEDGLIGSSLAGNIRRLQLGEPPFAELGKLDYKLTVNDRNAKGITVQFGRKAIRFPLAEMDSEQKRRLMVLMAESFAKGVVDNIVFYSQNFINGARDDLLKLKALEESLRSVLTKEARLTLKVSLRNAGDKAAVMKQYYAASLSAKQYSRSLLLIPIESDDGRSSKSVDSISRLAREIDGERSDSEAVESDALAGVLPSVHGGELIGVAGGEVKQLTLQSLKPLGDEGSHIVSLFQNDIIECQVHVFLTDGSRLSSKRIPFGKSAIEQEQQEVLKAAAS
ncbi:MAG: hypothetical protein JSR73_09115 [Proteobacteria bacterium]|nr:hypothetical protein [Pseudomonadota bacterium]